MLTIERRIGDVAILDVLGTFSPGTDDRLVSAVSATLAHECRTLLLNLRHAPSPGTPGITALIRTLLAAREAGTALKIVGIEPRFEYLLRIVGLYTYFDIFETEAHALADCGVHTVRAPSAAWCRRALPA